MAAPWKRRLSLSHQEGCFDALAEAYDRQFTHTAIGRMMREAVWARCAARFAAGSRVLEMNCGTGEDAAWLVQHGIEVLATDASPAMLGVARAKLAARPQRANARVARLAWEDLGSLEEAAFDGALSNFGGLNCVPDLRGAATALAARLRPGAVAILCIMGPLVPWEWLWYLAQGQPAKAFRRLRRGGTVWSGMAVHYPSVATTRRSFWPEFRELRRSALGALLPPPYAQNRLGRFPRAIAALNRAERRAETLWPLPGFADHYVIELQRV
jgi:SAM-dependent methyltransferase